MKKLILLLCVFTTSISYSQYDPNKIDCEKYKNPNEGTYATSDVGSSKNYWCNQPNQTTYVSCQCDKEKRINALNESYEKASVEWNNLIIKNREIFNTAMQYSAESDKYFPNKHSDDETTFNYKKGKAIQYLRTAILELERAEAGYGICIRLRGKNSNNCSTSNPWQSSIEELKGRISTLENLKVDRTDQIVVPNTNIVLQSDNYKSSSNSNSNRKTNSSTTETQQKSSQDFKLERDLKEKQSINNNIAKGNYVAASNEIKNSNQYTHEQKMEVHTKAFAQSTVQLIDQVADLFAVSPEIKKAREEASRKSAERMKIELKIENDYNIITEISLDFDSNGLAVKKDENGWYGIINQNNEWIIEPKYRERNNDFSLKEQIMRDFDSNGLAVKKDKNGLYGLVNNDDVWVIKPKYELLNNENSTLKEEIMSDFDSNGLAVKKDENGWYGFVNQDNEWVIKPKYIVAKQFENGKALVTSKTGRKFYINTKGKKL